MGQRPDGPIQLFTFISIFSIRCEKIKFVNVSSKYLHDPVGF